MRYTGTRFGCYHSLFPSLLNCRRRPNITSPSQNSLPCCSTLPCCSVVGGAQTPTDCPSVTPCKPDLPCCSVVGGTQTPPDCPPVVRCKPELPCCSVVAGSSTQRPCGLLFAAGTGIDPHAFIVLNFDIPFGPVIYSEGTEVTHTAGTPDFQINSSGNYRIDYQIAADNPAVGSGSGINITVNLVSSRQGVLDTISFTQKGQFVKKGLNVSLIAGDVLKLQAVQPSESEMLFNSQAFSIVRFS